MGDVLVLMYHRTGPEEKRMVRSRKNFANDLARLYKAGYRPVTLDEYTSNTMDIPRGASPVVMSFDDSDPSQLTMLKDGTVDPKCMVGIWMAFHKKHKDFPVKGTFFVLPNGPFGQSKMQAKKLGLLRSLGCEIGSHTALKKLPDEAVCKELGASYEFIKKLGFVGRSMATPYGIAPKNRKLLETWTYNGKSYRYANICLAGSSPAPSPLSKSFDRRRIPRVQAYNGTLGITYWLNREGKDFKPYVQP